jgi:hypothetical protein
MIRSILIAALLLGGGFALSTYNVGYSIAGEKYVSRHRDERKSLRPGYYSGRGGYGAFKSGK